MQHTANYTTVTFNFQLYEGLFPVMTLVSRIVAKCPLMATIHPSSHSNYTTSFHKENYSSIIYADYLENSFLHKENISIEKFIRLSNSLITMALKVTHPQDVTICNHYTQCNHDYDHYYCFMAYASIACFVITDQQYAKHPVTKSKKLTVYIISRRFQCSYRNRVCQCSRYDYLAISFEYRRKLKLG